MKNSDNKINLFRLIAETLRDNVIVPEGKEFYCTIEEDVIAKPYSLSISGMSPCSHEEEDTRIFLHMKDASEKGCKKAILKATDTDVVVIGLAIFYEIGLDELWIEYGTKDHLKWVPIHDIHRESGSLRC